MKTPNRRSAIAIASVHLLPTLAIMAIASGGCSKAEITQAIEDAKVKTQEITDTTVEAVKERLPERGSIKLRSTPAIETGQADVELISIGDGRPSVVRIISYDPDASSPSYPAVLLQGTTAATSASALAGQTVDCDMYVQSTSGATVAMTRPGKSVAVTFGSLNVEDNALSASLGITDLLMSDDQSLSVGGGEIVAVVRGEGN